MKYGTAGGLLSLLVASARGQVTSTTALDTSLSTSDTSTPTPTPAPTSTSTSAWTLPSASDNSPGGGGNSNSNGSNNNQSDPYNKSVVNYYFVFIALILCVAALGAFWIWRRKRRMSALLRNSRDNSLARDLSAWDPVRSRRRYWQGRWRSADVSREEGLNEHGEAPPPYVPKTQHEESANGLAVPLQTLTRDGAGLKPPDYTETDVRPVNPDETAASSNAESSTRIPDTRLMR